MRYLTVKDGEWITVVFCMKCDVVQTGVWGIRYSYFCMACLEDIFSE